MEKFSNADIEAIRNSDLFDAEWYLQQYPDVNALKMDPAEHYLWIGGRLRRNPSRKFNCATYLAGNSDISDEVNPLLHFLRSEKTLNSPDVLVAPPVHQNAKLKEIIFGAGNKESQDYYSNIENYISVSTGNKIVVYTAIFGEYDDLKDPQYRHSDVDYICFTDRDDLRSDIYMIKKVKPIFKNKTKNARMLKTLSHVFMPNYEISLWVDGSTKIRGEDFKELIKNKLKKKAIAVHNHFQRDCIYKEAEECIAQLKDDPENIKRQISYYRKNKYPEKFGLVETAQVLRKHTPEVKKFNEHWWELIKTFSVRDQLGFNYVCWSLDMDYSILDGCQWLDRNFKNYFHADNSINIYKDEKCVTLIMLVRNALEVTRISISSILQSTVYKNFKLIVVDNDSDLETKNYLQSVAKSYKNVSVLTNRENLSFSEANNKAAELSDAPYLLFINNDIEVIDPYWLHVLVDELGEGEKLAAVGPILLFPDYTIQSAGINVVAEKETIKVPAEEQRRYRHANKVDAVSGACMLVRSSVHKKIGGFDERFFYGQEDIDYCLKIKKLDFDIKLITRTELIHHESHTRKFTSQTLRNREIIKLKWKGKLGFLEQKNRPSQGTKGKSYLDLLRTEALNFRTFSDMLKEIKDNFLLIPEKVDLVVGVPRSGMIPAYMIGLMKNCPVISLDELTQDIAPTKGDRPLKMHAGGAVNVLIVDDSINFGNSYNRVKSKLKSTYNGDVCNYKFLAVYGSENWTSDDVLTISRCALPRLFQWNYTNHGIAQYACYDMDGVLCVDPSDAENDDGPIYESFILNARPLYIPKYKIKAIVTSRLEKYRDLTEIWLKNNGIEYEKLHMLDLPSKEERIRLNAHGKFKATIYTSIADAHVFIESNVGQSKEIAQKTGKRVICTANDCMY